MSVTDPAGLTAVRETDDVYRVYRPEWIMVHFEMASGDDELPQPLLRRVQEVFAERYAGRVHDTDVQFAASGAGINAVAQLLLRLPNIKGEFATEGHAHAYVREQGWGDATVVARNSKADHQLRQYSIRKLPV